MTTHLQFINEPMTCKNLLTATGGKTSGISKCIQHLDKTTNALPKLGEGRHIFKPDQSFAN